MRIALIHMRHAHTGGTERYLNLIASDLAHAGHKPVIVCRSHEEAPHANIEFALLRPFSLGAAQRMFGFAKAVERHVAAANYDLVFGLGKTWTHDVIRLGGGCHATYLELAHDSTRTRVERLLGKGARKHQLALEIERRALAADKNRIGGARPLVICNSNLVKRDVIERYALDPARVEVIHNGTDTVRFHPKLRDTLGAELRRELGWTEGEEVLLFLGTGYGRKGLGTVLAAAARLAPRRPALRTLVVGYDSNAAEYQARAKSLGIGERTAFLGGRRDPERCYAAADVYALPTRYDPFANSTLEAMACGLPTITTKTNGGSELIESGVSGHILENSPEESIDELAQAITHWLDHRAAGSLAARTAAECHDATHMTRATRSTLEALRAAN